MIDLGESLDHMAKHMKRYRSAVAGALFAYDEGRAVDNDVENLIFFGNCGGIDTQ